MNRKFQRKIQTVGGRLSPWKDDTNESRLIAAPVVQDAMNNTEPIDDGSVQNKYWQKRRKSAQVSTEYSLNIVFFPEFLKIFRTLAFLCFPSVSVCVHTPGW